MFGYKRMYQWDMDFFHVKKRGWKYLLNELTHKLFSKCCWKTNWGNEKTFPVANQLFCTVAGFVFLNCYNCNTSEVGGWKQGHSKPKQSVSEFIVAFFHKRKQITNARR